MAALMGEGYSQKSTPTQGAGFVTSYLFDGISWCVKDSSKLEEINHNY
jgi:hypothetical protein